MPAAPLRFSFKTGTSREGYVQVLLDDQQRPARLEIVDCNESIRTRTIAGFTVILSSPEVRALFLPLTEIPDQATILRKLSRLLRESQAYAELHDLLPPEIIRHTSAKKTHTERRLECGDTIEYFRSELPISIHEWAFNQERSTSKIVRHDQSGTITASLSTSRLRFPDGSQMREITIHDHRQNSSLAAPYRYMHLSRTNSDAAESDEAFLELLMDFQQDSLDTFLAPYHRRQPLINSRSPRAPSSQASREVQITEELASSGFRQLESGATISWDYAEGESLISVSASSDRRASVISFFPTHQKANQVSFLHAVDSLINADNPARMGSVFNSIISRFSFKIESCGDQSSRIRAVTGGLLEELPSSHMTADTASHLSRPQSEIFHDIIQGYEWIRFTDQRFNQVRASQVDRIATSISFRIWQGGCNLIILEEPDGTPIPIIPPQRYFFVGNIPDTRQFIGGQLQLFAENPLLLLKQHLLQGASSGPVLTIESSLNNLARLSIIQKMVEHDRISDTPMLSSWSFKSLALQCWHTLPGNRMTMLMLEPFRIELEIGDPGIQNIIVNRQNTLVERLRSWIGPVTELQISVPPALSRNTHALYQVMKAMRDELKENEAKGGNYYIDPQTLGRRTASLLDERLPQNPGPDGAERREHEQQRTTKDMDTGHPW